ncbi:maturation protein [ssRNA phage Gerhypos.4_32]|uniref:Maturation protein n=2 Tax=Fiersviridae TaxID=2842319 RepID=A0A8S5KYH2_9VIRU|nr:maturation protein [ssRNA phage Gerhypos.4_32]QDH86905.1 MAG: hypothetical protein H4Bulk46610_000002 [Leviviridae sp.]DAD50220.1 TPA_asm: maturation protein [ssRNA phage Gerhypos.4_32]
MPKSFNGPDIRGIVYRKLANSSSEDVWSTVAPVSKESLTCPVTNFRPKPVDLFLNRTARKVQGDVFRSEYGVWFDGTTRYRGPVSYIRQFQETDHLTGWPDHGSAMDGRLRAKIKSQNVNLAQTVAEYKQASRMFVDLSTDIVKTFRSLRNGRAFSDFVRNLQNPKTRIDKQIANRWLQYQYGIRPMMQDLYGTTDLLASKIRTGMWLHVKTSLNEQARKSVTERGGFYGNVVIDKAYIWSGKALARYKVTDPSLKTLAQCGISNPALLFWELIPYSFVVDWLFPVGDFLSSLDALNGVTTLQVGTGMKCTQIVVIRTSGGESVQTRTTTDRSTVRTNLSFPKLSYQPSTSLKAVVNGLALLSQLRK